MVVTAGYTTELKTAISTVRITAPFNVFKNCFMLLFLLIHSLRK